MEKKRLRFNLKEFLDINKLGDVELKSATIKLPFISLSFSGKTSEKKVAKELLIRLRDKRVLTSRECCDGCIKNATDSILEIRKLLIDKQVEIGNEGSSIFLLCDLMLIGIKQFLTHTENVDTSRNNWEYYFDALNILRGHIFRCIKEIQKLSGSALEFGSNMEFDLKWDEKYYLIEKQ